tara:strand:+ start:1084 stop:1815 length:732 start_codon:yes stop_codon:yes gene_type:complete
MSQGNDKNDSPFRVGGETSAGFNRQDEAKNTRVDDMDEKDNFYPNHRPENDTRRSHQHNKPTKKISLSALAFTAFIPVAAYLAVQDWWSEQIQRQKWNYIEELEGIFGKAGDSKDAGFVINGYSFDDDKTYLYKSLDSSGILYYGQHKNNKKNGSVWSFYPNGKCELANWVDDVKDGPFSEIYPDGGWAEGVYENGNVIGTATIHTNKNNDHYISHVDTVTGQTQKTYVDKGNATTKQCPEIP